MSVQMPEISVIIPSYNKESFLATCLESVLSQSFQDFEIILYDDVSMDKSAAICKQFAEKDKRIHYFQHSVNQGQQATIKDGVAHAAGRWIAFVDADDTLPADALETLFSLCNDDTDIVVGFSWQGDNSISHIPIKEWRQLMLRSSAILCTRWAKLYRTNLLNEETMSGLSSIKLGEDMIQNIKAAFRSEKPVTVIHKQVYVYNRNESSYSVGYKWTVEKSATLYSAVKNTLPDNPDPCYVHAVVHNGLGLLDSIILKGSPKERRLLKESSFIAELKCDIANSEYPLGLRQRLTLKSPSSLFTKYLFILSKSFQIVIRLAKKYLFKR